MKRFFAMMLALILLLALTACGPRAKSGTEEVVLADEGLSFTIDYDERTIRNGDDLYRYSFSGDYCIITYPNGAAYWDDEMIGLTEGDYDPERYIPGDVLISLLENERAARNRSQGNSLNFSVILGCVLLLTVGILGVAAPEGLLYLRGGWMFRNAEPTDFALAMGRIGGWIAIILAIVLFVAALLL